MMVKITSKQNEKIKQAKRLYRRRSREQTGLFLAEGLRLVEEALVRGSIKRLFYSNALLHSERGKELLDRAITQSVELYHCSVEVLAELTDTQNDQGILAVVKQPKPVTNWENQLDQACILVIDRVQDPGNLGTILRTALGAGISGVWLVAGTVDLFNPKVVRASMGAIFSLPFSLVNKEEVLDMCQANNLKLFVTDVVDGVTYYQSDFTNPLALVVGNEANGVDPTFTKNASARIFIPLTNQVESLNVSIATAVLLYEVQRQRIMGSCIP